MSEITVRPMMPEDWTAVSKIYLEGIATEHATFQTNCPPYTAWDASHTRECRLVVLNDGVVAGWAALHRVDPRWCYRGVAEVSIYVGEKFRGKGLGYHLLTALCREAAQQNGNDAAPLNHLIADVLAAAPDTRCLRDPTRGGLASTLNEFAQASGVTMEIDEDDVPVRPDVQAACEMLGYDVLQVANEGKMVAVVPAEQADAALAAMRAARY